MGRLIGYLSTVESVADLVNDEDIYSGMVLDGKSDRDWETIPE